MGVRRVSKVLKKANIYIHDKSKTLLTYISLKSFASRFWSGGHIETSADVDDENWYTLGSFKSYLSGTYSSWNESEKDLKVDISQDQEE